MVQKLIFLVVFIGVISSCSTVFSEEEKQQYLMNGKEIAEASFLELSSQLTEQMQQGGPVQAIPFCNQNALSITNQLSDKFDATIKRTSLKIRNPKNEPSEKEEELLRQYQKELKNNKQLTPVVEIDSNNKKHFYAPIILKVNCLVCHGKVNETVHVKTDSIIKSLYPNDQATGYNEGDLRGMWSITFKN